MKIVRFRSRVIAVCVFVGCCGLIAVRSTINSILFGEDSSASSDALPAPKKTRKGYFAWKEAGDTRDESNSALKKLPAEGQARLVGEADAFPSNAKQSDSLSVLSPSNSFPVKHIHDELHAPVADVGRASVGADRKSGVIDLNALDRLRSPEVLQTELQNENSSGQSSYPVLMHGKFIAPQRVVHFDLKGAPPRVGYFEKVFEMISGDLGATGVLMEYEDMFPYKGRLEKLRNGFAYSENDIRTILGYAKKYGLDVIPLVQSFGHMEWILKYPEFAHLREVERYAQVLCLSNNQSLALVKELFDQVLALHPDVTYFHVGADEAFQVGMCPVCQKNMRENLGGSRERLMLRHITAVASYLKQFNKKVLMWHDMLNNLDPRTAQEFNLGSMVEPVVWAYAEDLSNYLLPDMWSRFASIFPYIWGASAFKGADGPTRWWSNVPHYLANHVSWVTQMTKEYKSFREFRGIFLTGWQRFDHFAVLCELFPVGIPSLAVDLLTIKTGQYDRSLLKRAATALHCSNILDIESQGVAAYCNFPGFKVYQYIQQLRISKNAIEKQLLDDYQLRGWLSPFAIQHNYSSAWYLDQVVDKVAMYKSDIESLVRNLRAEMLTIFFPDCVDEFIFEYVEEDLQKLSALVAAARRVAQIPFFPRRPFPILLSNAADQTSSLQQQRNTSGLALGKFAPILNRRQIN